MFFCFFVFVKQVHLHVLSARNRVSTSRVTVGFGLSPDWLKNSTRVFSQSQRVTISNLCNREIIDHFRVLNTLTLTRLSIKPLL